MKCFTKFSGLLIVDEKGVNSRLREAPVLRTWACPGHVFYKDLTDTQSIGNTISVTLYAYFPLNLKRGGGSNILSTLNNDDRQELIVVGHMTIDSQNYEVQIDGRRILLTFREYELLRFLTLRRGRVFSRKELIENVWRHDHANGTRTVDVHVRRVRSKLGPQYGPLVETVRSVGYRFSRYEPQED